MEVAKIGGVAQALPWRSHKVVAGNANRRATAIDYMRQS